MKKQIRYILLAITLFGFNVASYAQKTDFSGLWKLNIEKSEFGDVPANAAAIEYNVEMKQNEISLRWNTIDNKGEIAKSNQKILLNEAEVSTVLPSERTRTISAKLTSDGKMLVLKKSYSKPGIAEETDYVLRESWSLNNGGKELMIELISPKYRIKAVYDKVMLTKEEERK